MELTSTTITINVDVGIWNLICGIDVDIAIGISIPIAINVDVVIWILICGIDVDNQRQHSIYGIDVDNHQVCDWDFDFKILHNYIVGVYNINIYVYICTIVPLQII